jgi:hypothetical protein
MMKNQLSWCFVLLWSLPIYGQHVSTSPRNFIPVNVNIDEVTYRSKQALRVTEKSSDRESIAIVRDLQFSSGVIEVELAGTIRQHANAAARGFIGIAFRTNNSDSLRYSCFYLRPTNGRADDQLRRNHSTQYIAHPEFPWECLRNEFPGKYESYVDLEEGVWTNVKIVVKGSEARLYVHHSNQPALIVHPLLNAEATGSIALWIGQGTEGYFRSLTVTKD